MVVWRKGWRLNPLPPLNNGLTRSAIELCELFRRSTSNAAVRTIGSVVAAPSFDLASWIEQIAEPAYSQAVFPLPSVETLHVCVFHRLTWPDVY
jgi:hypothetical protein